MTALVLTYHLVEDGPGPLRVAPKLFAEQLDALAEASAVFLTVRELARSMRRGEMPPRAVAITFDDAAASVVEEAAPLLAERGLPATVFCVADYLGGRADWPSQPAWARGTQLASVSELASLAEAGVEIGSHGATHAPLASDDPELLERELAGSRRTLEAVLGSEVTSFAYPYGTASTAARLVARRVYETTCSARLEVIRGSADPGELPRVDSHYLRSPERLVAALTGSLDLYLGARRFGRLLRRLVVKGYGRTA